MSDVWLYASSTEAARATASAFAELGYIPRHARLGRDVLPDAPGSMLRPPRLAAIVAGSSEELRTDLVRELATTELLHQTPILLSLATRHLRAAATLGAEHEVLVRPFSLEELRLRSARATRAAMSATPGQDRVEIGELVLDEAAYRAWLNEEPLAFTRMEFELLLFLARNPSRVFSREALLTRVWGYRYDGGARTVDVHVRRLRAKLSYGTGAPRIRTVRRVGYVLEGATASPASLALVHDASKVWARSAVGS